MAAYIVHNISGSNISLEIAPPPGSGRYGTSLTIGPNEMVDILPYAGSIDNCKLIRGLANLRHLNRVEITCQP